MDEENSSNCTWCFDYSDHCSSNDLTRCTSVHEDRYSDASAAWVLIAAIIVFFMKAGFMLIEVAFARDTNDRRHVIILKYQDVFASAFGFFLIGYDLSNYYSPYTAPFFATDDPILWFFKFTFASNTATIVGGCLVSNRYKMRLPAAFVSAFVISGIIHPLVAKIIWSDDCIAKSPYRFCSFASSNERNCSWTQLGSDSSYWDRLYILDFAGGGAVHGIGGIAGLVLCLFAKLQEWRDKERQMGGASGNEPLLGAEPQEESTPEIFWKWMYPDSGGDETAAEAALGVTILWFSWFAFNCGTTESVDVGHDMYNIDERKKPTPFYWVPAIVALNMILAGASGGITAIAIAVWAQLRYRTESLNANEIANGILSALVSITAGCAFVDYWGAVFIGSIGVLLYHVGGYFEYKFGIKDTARVFPVHGLCGIWSVIAIAIVLIPGSGEAQCNLHAAYEGLCYCELRLPKLNYFERLGAQVFGAVIMILLGASLSFVMYFILYITPIKPIVFIFEKIFFLNYKAQHKPLHEVYRGGLLLTTPEDKYITLLKDSSLPARSVDQNHARLKYHSVDRKKQVLMNERDSIGKLGKQAVPEVSESIDIGSMDEKLDITQ